MKLNSNIKSIVDTIKYKKPDNNQPGREKRATGVIALALSLITAIMSIMNFIQHQYEMMIATTVLTLALVCIFIISLVIKLERMVDLSLCAALSMLCVYFTLTGGNDGFAILWTLLLPPSTMLFMELMTVASIGVFFEVFFIILFWTPLNSFVGMYYSQTFMLRFPMLYTAFFMLSFLAKYLMTKHEIAEHNYIETIESLSLIDQLTNIPNRRSFEERLRQEWNRAIRHQEPLSILFVDVDKFKNYNDTYGHLQGDKALQMVASEFAKALKRSIDFVARWGGEEFAVLLSDTEGEHAFTIAERIRIKIAETEVPLDDGETTYLTISIGINSQTPTLNCLVDDFIRCADDALYSAKSEGRNRAIQYKAS